MGVRLGPLRHEGSKGLNTKRTPFSRFPFLMSTGALARSFLMSAGCICGAGDASSSAVCSLPHGRHIAFLFERLLLAFTWVGESFGRWHGLQVRTLTGHTWPSSAEIHACSAVSRRSITFEKLVERIFMTSRIFIVFHPSIFAFQNRNLRPLFQ